MNITHPSTPEDDKTSCLRFDSDSRQTVSPPRRSRARAGAALINARAQPGPATPPASGGRRVALDSSSRIGFALLVIFLFALYARPFDFARINAPILPVFGIPALVITFLTRRFIRPFTTSIGACLLGFTVWMMVAVPFSVWKGGSVIALKGWLRSVILFVLVSSFAVTYRHLRVSVTVIAVSVVAVSIISLLVGSTESGRLDVGSGKFGNPNDLAQVIVMALPMLWFIGSRPALAPLWRAFAVACMLPLFLAFAKTGSRGGLIALVCTLAAFFFLAPLSRRVMIAAGVLIMGSVSFVTLPESLRQRFTNMSGERSEDATALNERAAASFQDRRQLLKDSVTLTLAHPITGVGPGQFSVAQNDLAVGRGAVRGSWHQTHNTFTQVSSETGLPGFVLYCAALIGAFRALRFKTAGSSDEMRELRALGQYLRLSLLAFGISAMFTVSAYDIHVPVLAGLAVAFLDVSKAMGSPAAPRSARPA